MSFPMLPLIFLSPYTMNGCLKEISDRKILEGLLKHPENRECADCKQKVQNITKISVCFFFETKLKLNERS